MAVNTSINDLRRNYQALRKKLRVRYGLGQPATGYAQEIGSARLPTPAATPNQAKQPEPAQPQGKKQDAKKQPAAQPSLADLLIANGATVEKKSNYIPESRAQKPNVEYMRDPVTKKAKQDYSLQDVMLLLRQTDPKTRPFTDQQFADSLAEPTNPNRDPYYSYESNDELAKKLLGKTSFDASDFNSPEALQDYQSLLWSKDNLTPLAPTTRGYRSTKDYQRAYKRWHAQWDYADWSKALSEMPALYTQIGELAALPENKGKSADEIVDQIDYDIEDEDGNKALSAIKEYKKAEYGYTAKWTSGGGLFVGDESLRAVAEAALRGEDVSRVKDYLYSNTSKNYLDMVGRPEEEITDKGQEQDAVPPNPWERINKSLNSLAYKAAMTAAGAIGDTFAPRPDQMPDPLEFEAQTKKDLEQSFSTTGKMDLRDPSVSEDQWPFLVDAGLASQAQMDALNAEKQGNPLSLSEPGKLAYAQAQRLSQGALYINTDMVDASNRPQVTVSKDNLATIRGWGDADAQVGDVMTVDSQTISDGKGTAILISPIMGSGGLLTQEQLDGYASKLFDKGIDNVAKNDQYGLVLGVFNEGSEQASIDKANAYGEAVHLIHADQLENPTRQKERGMAQGSTQPQAAINATNMTPMQAVKYRTTLVNQAIALDKYKQEEQTRLAWMEQDIAYLQNDLATSEEAAEFDDLRVTDLKNLLATREEILAGQPAREQEGNLLKEEIAAANQAIDEMLYSKAAQAAAQPGRETQEQRTQRLSTVNIDDQLALQEAMGTVGLEAQNSYENLTAKIDELNGMVGGMASWQIEQDPTLVAASKELEEKTAARKALVDKLAAQGIDITSAGGFETAQMRLKADTEDAAVIQYSGLSYVMWDYEPYASKGLSRANPKMDYTGIDGLAGMDKLPDAIHNPAVFAKDNAKNIVAAMQVNHQDMDISQLTLLHDMAYMSADETKNYSYLLENPIFGKEKADLYFEGLRPYLAARQGEEFYLKYLKDHPWRTVGYNMVQGYANTFTGIQQVITPSAIDYSAGEYAGMMGHEGLSPGWKWVDQTGKALSGMVPSILAQSAFPGWGTAVIAASAYGNTKRQALQEGYSVDEAYGLALTNALSEAFLEKVLGTSAQGGGKLLKLFGANGANVASGALWDAAKGLVGTMASNGTEEYLQDVLQPVWKMMATDERFKGIDWTDPQAIESGFIGAFTAVIADTPGILGKINGTKALGTSNYQGLPGVPLNGPMSLSAMVVAGQNVPDTSVQQSAYQAEQKIDENQGKLDPYRAGKLALSILGNDEATARYNDLMQNGLFPQPAKKAQPQEAPKAVGEPAQEAAPQVPEEQQAEELPELTREEQLQVSTAANQAAYEASQDESQYPPELARYTERVQYLNQSVGDSLKAQLEALTKADELTNENTEILTDVVNGKADAGAVTDKVAKNVKAITQHKMDAETYKTRYTQAQAELPTALENQALAMGDYRDAIFFKQKAELTAKMRQEKLKAQQATEAMAAEAAARKEAEARLPEVEAKIKEAEEQDAALALNEEQAKKQAMDALAAENDAMVSKTAMPGEVAEAQNAARAARDNYTKIQRQRRELGKQLEQFKKERQGLANQVMGNQFEGESPNAKLNERQGQDNQGMGNQFEKGSPNAKLNKRQGQNNQGMGNEFEGESPNAKLRKRQGQNNQGMGNEFEAEPTTGSAITDRLRALPVKEEGGSMPPAFNREEVITALGTIYDEAVNGDMPERAAGIQNIADALANGKTTFRRVSAWLEDQGYAPAETVTPTEEGMSQLQPGVAAEPKTATPNKEGMGQLQPSVAASGAIEYRTPDGRLVARETKPGSVDQLQPGVGSKAKPHPSGRVVQEKIAEWGRQLQNASDYDASTQRMIKQFRDALAKAETPEEQADLNQAIATYQDINSAILDKAVEIKGEIQRLTGLLNRASGGEDVSGEIERSAEPAQPSVPAQTNPLVQPMGARPETSTGSNPVAEPPEDDKDEPKVETSTSESKPVDKGNDSTEETNLFSLALSGDKSKQGANPVAQEADEPETESAEETNLFSKALSQDKAKAETSTSKSNPVADDETPKDRLSRLLGTDYERAVVDPNDLMVDPETYQFKSGADKNGVTKPMEGDYIPLYADDIVVHRRNNGDMYIADGHHRREFAIRNGINSMKAIILDESNGVTAQDARLIAAARNMSQNHGEPLDAAKVMRDAKITAEDLARYGLSATNSVIEKGSALAQLTPEYWRRATTGQLDLSIAYVMGKHFPNDEKMQAAYMSFVAKQGGRNLSDGTKEELALMMESSEAVERPGEQFSFFDEPDLTAVEVAELVSRVRKRLRRTHTLFDSLSKEGKQRVIESVGQNRLDPDANRDTANDAVLAADLLKNVYTKGAAHDIIYSLAKESAEGKISMATAVDRAADKIIQLAKKKGVVIGGVDADTGVSDRTGDRPASQGTPGSGREGSKGTTESKPAGKPATGKAGPAAKAEPETVAQPDVNESAGFSYYRNMSDEQLASQLEKQRKELENSNLSYMMRDAKEALIREIEAELERRKATKGKPKTPKKPPKGTPGSHALRAGSTRPLRPGQAIGEHAPKNPAVRRASAIAKDLYEALGAKFTSKNRPRTLRDQDVSLYLDHPRVVVTRTFQNVAAYAHEVGHYLFARANAFDGLGDPTPSFRAAIDGMVFNLPANFTTYYTPDELPQEAAAEFVRNYLTDRNAAIDFAGVDFVERFENEMLNRKERRAMDKARNEFNRLQEAEDTDILQNYRAMIISHKDDTGPDNAEGWWGRTLQRNVDKFYSVLLFDRAASKLGYDNSNPAKRAYIAFSDIAYSSTQASNIISLGLTDIDGNRIGDSLKTIMRQIRAEDMTDFNVYLTALHDIDRQAQDKAVFGQYDAETSTEVKDRLAAAHPEFVDVQQELIDWWDRFIDEWVVKPNTFENAKAKIDLFREKYPNYVPTYRGKHDAMDTMEEELGDMGGILGQAMVHFRKAKGGDEAIYSPIESFVARIAEVVTGANKVIAMRRIHETYQAAPDGLGKWIIQVPETKVTGNEGDELLRVIDEDGTVFHYQVMDKLLYDALLNQTTKEDTKVWEFVGALTGAFKQLTTMSNPFFALSNAMRDYGEAWTKGSNADPITFTYQWIKAICELTRAQITGRVSETLGAYYGMGGGDSSIAPQGREGVQHMERTLYSQYFRDSLRRMTREDSFKARLQGTGDALHATGSRLKEVINAFNNVIEGSQRYAEFSRTYNRTGDARAAMYASTNVTTDFRRAGSSNEIHHAGQVFAFLNAGLQGTYSWYRMAKEARFDRRAFVTKAVKASVLFAMVPIAQALLIKALGGDDKEAYDLMAENVKEDNYIIPKFWASGRGSETERFIKIPKSKGPLPVIGDTIGRALIEAMQKDGTWDAFAAYGTSDFLMRKGASLLDSVNPYGSPIFAPAMQIIMNQTWYYAPIESQWMRDRNVAPVNRIRETTSGASIFIANKLGFGKVFSPIQIDYFLNQTLGVAGDYLTGDAGNAVFDRIEGNPSGYKPLSSTAAMIRARLNTDPTVASDITSTMYSMGDLLTGIVTDSGLDGPHQNPYARLNTGLTSTEQKAAVATAKKLTKKGGILAKAEASTSKHYDEIDKVNANETLDDNQKAIKIRQIKYQMLLENMTAVRTAEDYVRKYIKGTPALYAKVYGKK